MGRRLLFGIVFVLLLSLSSGFAATLVDIDFEDSADCDNSSWVAAGGNAFTPAQSTTAQEGTYSCAASVGRTGSARFYDLNFDATQDNFNLSFYLRRGDGVTNQIRIATDTAYGDQLFFGYDSGVSSTKFMYWDGGSSASTVDFVVNTWYRIDVLRNGNEIEVYADSSLINSFTRTGKDMSFFGAFMAGTNFFIDNLEVCSDNTCDSPTPPANDSIETVVELRQDTPITINSNTFETVYAANFQADYNGSAYTSTTIESFSTHPLERTQQCRVTIDGTDYNSQGNRTMTQNILGNAYLISTNFTVIANQTYDVALECRRVEAAGQITINKSDTLVHLLYNSNGSAIPSQTFQETYSLTSATPQLLFNGTFNTSETNVSPLQRYLIIDGKIQYDYTSDSNMTLYAVIEGEQSEDFIRYGDAGTSGDGGGVYIVANVTGNSSIPVQIWGSSSSTDGSVLVTATLKEIVSHSMEGGNINITGKTISSSSWTDIAYLTINNTHSGHAVVTKGGISTTGSVASTVYYRITVDGQTSQEYQRGVAVNQNGVSIVQELFEGLSVQMYNVTLQARVDSGTATINGGNVGVYLAEEGVGEVQGFNVTIYDSWTNESLTNFTVINEQGTIFQDVNGTAFVISIDNFDNLTIVKQNYFNGTEINYNVSSNLNKSMFQAYVNFDAFEIITNNTVSPANFTIDGITKTDSEFFEIAAGTYNVTFSASTYFDKTVEVTIGVLDNETYNITDVSGSVINVTAQEYYLGTEITSFTVIINNTAYGYSTNYTVTTGWVSVSVIQGTPFTINVTADGYISNITTINSTVSLYNHTAKLYDDSKILINFFDEVTLNPVTNVTWELYAINAEGYGIPVTSTDSINNATISNIPAGFYGIEYTKDNYTVRNYFVLVPLTMGDETNLSLYLLESQYATTFVAQVTDRSNQAIEDIYASVLRRYVIDNQTQYRVVDMFKPSFALGGTAPFTAEANSVAYLFRVNQDDGTLLYQGSATTSDNYESLYLVDTEIFLRINRESSGFDSFTQFNNVQVSLTNSSTTFWLSWSDSESELTQMCLQVKGNNTDVISNQCSTEQSGILSYTTDGANSSFYVARAIGTVTANAQEYPFGILHLDFRPDLGKTLFGVMGVFMLVLTLILTATALAHKPGAAILVAVFSVIAFSTSVLGIVAISLGLQSTVFAIGMVLVFMTGGDK